MDAGDSLKTILGIFQDGASLVTHSQILLTFQDGSRVKFATPGIVVDVKIPTHVRFTKSNSPGLPDPPILGQTNDKCINYEITEAIYFEYEKNNNFKVANLAFSLCVELVSLSESAAANRDFKLELCLFLKHSP